MSIVLADKLEELGCGMVADAVEDYTDLSFFVDDIREVFGVADEEALMLYTTAILPPLLDEGLIRAGVPTEGGGVEAWDLSAHGVVRHIQDAWSSLERTPYARRDSVVRCHGEGRGLRRRNPLCL